MVDEKDILHEAKEAFQRASDAEDHNRISALEDIRFAKLGDQWPEQVLKDRQAEQRPCLTINKMTSFIRQVVNDARQNKPSIKVRAVDSNGDPETADIINGLIRNIEYTSNADVAYDTAIESAVTGGFGYIRVGMDYAFDDTFDMDITIDRVLNPFSVYGDPDSTAGDSSDWNVAFVVDRYSEEQFKSKYGDVAKVDWDSDAWSGIDAAWRDDEGVLVAEYWVRKEVEREIVLLSNDNVIAMDDLQNMPDAMEALNLGLLEIKARRKVKSYQVMQYTMTGVEVLKMQEWPGRFIPIVPVYGDEFSVQGKRYFRSLINQAKDAQRMVNFWRTNSTELVALAPRVPWIGRKGTFNSDGNRWATANSKSHAYLEFDTEMPQRQPLDVGVAAGSLQEALNAVDDIKSIIGMYDASLGARSNETSGRAILARQREGDVATFHFIDNLSRAIRHLGRIIIDLIPYVYTGERVVRVIGEDGQDRAQKVNGPTEQIDPKTGEPVIDPQTEQPVMRIFDLTAGKYDLTVSSGPSFTTRREEAAAQMTELVRAFPMAAPYVADIMARNFDWPGADEIAERFKMLVPGQETLPEPVQRQMQEMQQALQKLQSENEQLKSKAAIEQAKVENDTDRVQIDQYRAETDRLKMQADTGMQVIDRLTPPAQVAGSY